MPLETRRSSSPLAALHLWAVADTSAKSLATERERKLNLAKQFTPELRVDRKQPHPLLQKLVATQKQQESSRTTQPSKISVQRMAAILKALDANKGTGKPLSEIFRKRRN